MFATITTLKYKNTLYLLVLCIVGGNHRLAIARAKEVGHVDILVDQSEANLVGEMLGTKPKKDDADD